MDPNKYRGWSPQDLSAELTSVEARLRVLHQDRSGKPRELSPDEQREFNETLVDRDAIDSAIKRHAGIGRAFQGGRVLSAYHGLDRGAGAGIEFDVMHMRGAEARSQALRLLEERGSRLKPDQADRVDALINDESSEGADEESLIARRILLTENPAY